MNPSRMIELNKSKIILGIFIAISQVLVQSGFSVFEGKMENPLYSVLCWSKYLNRKHLARVQGMLCLTTTFNLQVKLFKVG